MAVIQCCNLGTEKDMTPDLTQPLGGDTVAENKVVITCRLFTHFWPEKYAIVSELDNAWSKTPFTVCNKLLYVITFIFTLQKI